MKSIAFFNLKGGVGKTAAAINVAWSAAAEKTSTVLWDLDAQGAAGWTLCGDRPAVPIKQVWQGQVPIGRVIQRTRHAHLDLVPSAFSNRNADALLSDLGVRRKLLARLANPLSEAYELLVFDCPPSLSRLADHVFYAVDAVVVPVVPTPLSLRAFEQVRDYLKAKVRKPPRLLPFYSMVDRRKKLHREWLDQPPKPLKNLLPVWIPYASIIERMGLTGGPVGASAPRDPQAERFRQLWQAIDRRTD